MLCWTKVGGVTPYLVVADDNPSIGYAIGPNQAADDLDQRQAAEKGCMWDV